MSIFGTNRFNNISLNDSDKNINESSCDAMINSVTDLEFENNIIESKIDINDYIKDTTKYIGLMESIMNIIENDNKLFENLLGYDFLSTSKNNTMQESSIDNDLEMEKQGIVVKEINKLFSCTISSIANETKIFTDKLESFLESDKKVFNKYSPNLKMNMLENFVLEDFSFPNEEKANLIDSIISIGELTRLFNESIEKIYNINNIHTVVEECNNKIIKYRNYIYENIDDINIKGSWTPTEESINFINSFSNHKNIIDSIQESIGDLIYKLELLKENLYNDNSSINVFSESVKEIDNAKYYGIYNIVSSILKEVMYRVNIYNDLIIKEVADTRKALILCGRKAIDELSETNTLTNNEINSIVESSDIYVFDKFN